jgi:hypothetical protein
MYEASDWAYAVLTADALEEWYTTPTAAQLATVTKMMTALGVTEVDRRRARMETDRAIEEPEGEAVGRLHLLKAKSSGGS